MRIGDLGPEQVDVVQEMAALLVRGFATQAPTAWPTLADALAEVHASFGPDRLSRVARDERGAVLGWVGAMSQYDGDVWELHPLVVDPTHRRQGIGRALVTDLEARVRERGGHTLWLGADDEMGQTTLGGVDLYPDICVHLAAIRNLREHPLYLLPAARVRDRRRPARRQWLRQAGHLSGQVPRAATNRRADARPVTRTSRLAEFRPHPRSAAGCLPGPPGGQRGTERASVTAQCRRWRP